MSNNFKMLDDFKVDKILTELKQDDLKFLNLSGRKTFHSQGFYGQGIIVAVVDTGVNEHNELKGRILKGKNFCKYRNSSNTSDDNGHGTHVAGSIAGANVGIAPKAQILPVKVLSGDGDGNIKDIIKALKWAKKYKHEDGRKVSIVSMSLSTNGKRESSKTMNEFHQAIKDLVNDNIAVICSAGNTYIEEKRYPAAYDEVICVGAVDINKQKAMFSTTGNHVDVCQVGVDVISCDYQNKNGYRVLSGTSMSTPIVSGIAALIACKYKEQFGKPISEEFLWKLLRFNTKDIGIKGVDKLYGAGFCTLQPLELCIEIQKDNKIAVVNGENVELETPATIDNGHFLIPARFFAQNTGEYINYNSATDIAKFMH